MTLCSGRLTGEDARRWYEDMNRKRILEQYNLPTKPSSDGYYHVYLKSENGRRQIKAKTLKHLEDKVVELSKHLLPTFQYVFECSQEEKLKYVKDPEKRASMENTIYRTKTNYRRFFHETSFEKMPISEISKEDVEEVCMENLTKYDLKKKAFLALRGILKAVFQYAFEQYWIFDNVYDRVDFRKYNLMLMRDSDVNKRVHSDNEIQRMQEYIVETHQKKPEYLPAYALELQMEMGLRIGEVPPLMWSDIVNGNIIISKEQINIRTTRTNQIVEHTKTWKDRTYPVTSSVREILNAIREIHDSEYLFPADTNTGVITNKSIYQYYYRMCKKLNIKLSYDLRKGTHSFRRNAITNVVNKSNGNFVMAAQLFGNTPEVARDYYYTGININDARSVLEG